MPPWLITLSWIAVALGLVTSLALAVEVSRRPEQMAIMNIVWPITGLYFPLVAFWLYAVMGRPMTRAAMKQAAGGQHRWKSIFVSATHCGAGCVIGDLLGAPVAFAFGWSASRFFPIMRWSSLWPTCWGWLFSILRFAPCETSPRCGQ